MAEAELRIVPTVAPTQGEGLARSAVQGLERVQRSAMTKGAREVHGLQRAYEHLAKGVGRVREGIRSTVDSIFSVKSAILGVVAGTAGKTFYDLTIGQADKYRHAKAELREMFGSVAKGNQALKEAHKLTNEIASMSFQGAISGMQAFAATTGGNVKLTAEAVKMAKVLEATKPEEGFEGAVLAINELVSTGKIRTLQQRFESFASIKELMPKPAQLKRLAKKAGKSIAEYRLDILKTFIKKHYGGVEKQLQLDANTVKGQAQMLETAVQDAFLPVGQILLPTVLSGVKTAAASFKEMAASPDFKKSMQDFGKWVGGSAEKLAKVIPKFIKGVPHALHEVRAAFHEASDFYENHKTLLKALAGFYIANKLSGGLAASMIKGVAGAGVGIGAKIVKKGGSVVSAAEGAVGCCCHGGIGGAAGAGVAGDIEGAAGGAAATATTDVAATATEDAAPGLLGFLAAKIPELGEAALPGLLLAGSGIGSFAITKHVAGDLMGLDSYDSLAGAKPANTPQDRRRIAQLRTRFGHEFSKDPHELVGIKRDVVAMLGGPNANMGQGKQRITLGRINAALRQYGLKADLGTGEAISRIKFSPTDTSQLPVYKRLAKELNNYQVTVNVHLHGIDTHGLSMAGAASAGRAAGEAAAKAMKRELHQHKQAS